MKINPNDRYLSLVLKTLENTIFPELTSSAAKGAADMIRATLIELLKRESGTQSIIRDNISQGEILLHELKLHLDLVKSDTAPETIELMEGLGLEQLRTRHAELTSEIAILCEQVSLEYENTGSALLCKVAEWEASYYTKQAQLSLPKLPSIENSGSPLTRNRLQDYLNSMRDKKQGSIELTSFMPLMGGFGKQTFLCEFTDQRGNKQDLVVRKTDPTPIMQHSACLLENEYDLLKIIASTGFPAPTPLHFSEGWKDIDGSFYTMNRIPGVVAGSYLEGGGEGTISEKVVLELAELLARLHSIPLITFEDYIAKYEDPRIVSCTVEQTYRHNIEGWIKYIEREEHLPSPFLSWLVNWLSNNIPVDDRRPVLIHGDFNVHNVLVHDDQVSAVLDWECAGFGSPEQDMAYIRPNISKHINWERFVNHYIANGGKPLNSEAMKYGTVYAALRTNLAGNRASQNLQSGANEDLRYAMVELGFTASFMQSALKSATSS
ncbi:phosphotransferase family protein [Alteromonas sp. M12]|uniref:phosphotransferase family protein n=1 Tax=Alteromonas sp. M12 TaxID=3135644 RepID=UPI00319E1C2E